MQPAAVPSVPESAPEIISTETLDALARVIDEVRAAPASQVVRLGGMKVSPGAERIAQMTGRVLVSVNDEAVVVRPSSGCNRCNGSTAYRAKVMHKGVERQHPCECVSRQVRKAYPPAELPRMKDRAAEGASIASSESVPASTSTLEADRRAVLERKLAGSIKTRDEAIRRREEALRPHREVVAERQSILADVEAGLAHWSEKAEAVAAAEVALRTEIAELLARIEQLRVTAAARADNAREIAGYLSESRRAQTAALAHLAEATEAADKVLHRRQKDVDRAADDVARLERKIAEMGPVVVGHNAEDGVSPGAPIYRRVPVPEGCEVCAGCPDCLTNSKPAGGAA